MVSCKCADTPHGGVHRVQCPQGASSSWLYPCDCVRPIMQPRCTPFSGAHSCVLVTLSDEHNADIVHRCLMASHAGMSGTWASQQEATHPCTLLQPWMMKVKWCALVWIRTRQPVY